MLADLQETTRFSSTELQALLNHFSAHCADGAESDCLNRETFFTSLSQGEREGWSGGAA